MRLYLAFIFSLSLAVPSLHADTQATGQLDQSSFAGTAQGDIHEYNGPSQAEEGRVKKLVDALLRDDKAGANKTPAAADPDSSTAN